MYEGLLILQMNYRKEEGSISDGSLLMKKFILSGNHSPFVCEERMCFLLLLVLTLEAETEGSVLFSCMKLLLSSPTEIHEVCGAKHDEGLIFCYFSAY